MTSHQVKNQVRDSFEQGFDSLHRVADVVTFPLAPLDGAIHGTARGVLNWLTDTHPGDRSNSKQKCLPNGGGYGGGYGGGHGGGYGGGNGRNGGGYPLGINPNRKLVTVKGNQISDNKADAQAFNNFANQYNRGHNGNYHDNGQGFNNSGNRNNGGYNGQNHDDDDDEDDAIFGFEDNKISGNQGKVKGFNDFGNQYY
ncbi:hypothetical protein ACE6H2_001154 [Prunus campanulata]